MSQKTTLNNPIDPDLTYTTDQLARIFGVELNSLHRRYIATQIWPHKCLFKGVYAVPGWVIIRWIDRGLEWTEESLGEDPADG